MALSRVVLPNWVRGIAVAVGILSILLAFVVLVFPRVALLTLVFLLAIALLCIGIERLIAGITGQPYAWATLAGPTTTPPSTVAPTTPTGTRTPPA